MTELHVVAEEGTGMLARRAAAFSVAPRIWHLEGRALQPARAEPLPPEPDPPELTAPLRAVLEAARSEGAEVVAEHGVISVEVLGLEVARVEAGPDGPELSIGVGRHDREARRTVHGGLPGDARDPVGDLRGVVSQVQARRRGGGPSHPANQLAPERWLRALLVRRPELVGAGSLVAVSPPVARPNLRSRAVAPAVGTDGGGDRMAVVCSTGVDPELVPAAVDVRVGAGPCRLVLVVPERDDHPVTRRLVGMLSDPAEIRTVPTDWRELHSPSPS